MSGRFTKAFFGTVPGVRLQPAAPPRAAGGAGVMFQRIDRELKPAESIKVSIHLVPVTVYVVENV